MGSYAGWAGMIFDKSSKRCLGTRAQQLIDAVVHGYIAERRAKYLHKWFSTVCGTFRINPPSSFFLWSDI